MYRLRHEYDALHRPTTLHVRGGDGVETIAERVVYGEGQANDLGLNLRGKTFQEFDGAGIVTHEGYDFKGNLSRTTRKFLRDYRREPDWASSPPMAETEFRTSSTYDAFNRLTTLTTPDGSVARTRYDVAGRLRSLDVSVRGASQPTAVVARVDYNARGQRLAIEYGNGASSRYTYDPLTFRMIRLLTTRRRDRVQLQDLRYAFDPVGNITSIRDESQQTVYFRNQAVPASNEYSYDAVYRLVSAHGREHVGVSVARRVVFDDLQAIREPLPSDGSALRRYHELYEYDPVGNILALIHEAAAANWSRHYSYDDVAATASREFASARRSKHMPTTLAATRRECRTWRPSAGTSRISCVTAAGSR